MNGILEFLRNWWPEILIGFIVAVFLVTAIVVLLGHKKEGIGGYKSYFVYNVVVFLSGLVGGSFVGFYHLPYWETRGAFQPKVFWGVWDDITLDYYKSVDQKKLFDGSLKGMVKSVEDKYTYYLTEGEVKKSKEYLPGDEIWGYGFDCEGCYEVTPAGLEILNIFIGSPAEKLGIGPGDVINFIDGCGLGELTDKLIEPGVHTFKITKFFTGELVELIFAPRKFKFKGVTHWVSDEGVAYIWISQFEGDVVEEFEAAVIDVTKKNPKGLILDLRGNLGGDLDKTIKIADAWIPGKVVMIERYRSGKTKDVYSQKSKVSGKLRNLKTVILVDRNTASASEVLTGALKYHRPLSVFIVGKRTRGKVTAWYSKELPNGAEIRVTTCEWLNPGGIKFDNGIKPDHEIIECEDVLRDCALDKAMEIFNTQTDTN